MYATRQIGHGSILSLGDMNTLPEVVAHKVNTFMEMTHLGWFGQLCLCNGSVVCRLRLS